MQAHGSLNSLTWMAIFTLLTSIKTENQIKGHVCHRKSEHFSDIRIVSLLLIINSHLAEIHFKIPNNSKGWERERDMKKNCLAEVQDSIQLTTFSPRSTASIATAKIHLESTTAKSNKIEEKIKKEEKWMIPILVFVRNGICNIRVQALNTISV